MTHTQYTTLVRIRHATHMKSTHKNDTHTWHDTGVHESWYMKHDTSVHQSCHTHDKYTQEWHTHMTRHWCAWVMAHETRHWCAWVMAHETRQVHTRITHRPHKTLVRIRHDTHTKRTHTKDTHTWPDTGVHQSRHTLHKYTQNDTNNNKTLACLVGAIGWLQSVGSLKSYVSFAK